MHAPNTASSQFLERQRNWARSSGSKMCLFIQWGIQVLSSFSMGKMTLEQRFLTWGPNVPKKPMDRLRRGLSVKLDVKNSIFIFTNLQLAFLSIMNVGHKAQKYQKYTQLRHPQKSQIFSIHIIIVADTAPKWYPCLLSHWSGILNCLLVSIWKHVSHFYYLLKFQKLHSSHENS